MPSRTLSSADSRRKRMPSCQCLGPHIGREQLRMALFKTEVRGLLVAEEHVAMANEELIDARHRGFGGGIVAQCIPGSGIAAPNPCASRKGSIHSNPHSSGRTTRFSSRVVSRVSQSYIQRAYFSLNMCSVQVYQRLRSCRWTCIDDEPDNSHNHNQRNIKSEITQ